MSRCHRFAATATWSSTTLRSQLPFLGVVLCVLAMPLQPLLQQPLRIPRDVISSGSRRDWDHRSRAPFCAARHLARATPELSGLRRLLEQICPSPWAIRRLTDLKDHGDDHIKIDLLTAFKHRLYEDREEIRESCRREDAATAGTDGTDTTCGSTLGDSAASATSRGTPGTASIGESRGFAPSRRA